MSRNSGETFPVDIGFRLPEMEKAATSLHVAPRQHRGEHVIRSGGQIELLTTAVEKLAASVILMAQNSRQNRNRPMTYAEAAAETGLSQAMLERMVSSGELEEGRHFIGFGKKADKNGRIRYGRILFHGNLLDFLFEDRRRAKKTEKALIAEPDTEKKASSKPRQNQSALNFNYGRNN